MNGQLRLQAWRGGPPATSSQCFAAPGENDPRRRWWGCVCHARQKTGPQGAPSGTPVLVSSGCHAEAPEPGQPEPQAFLSAPEAGRLGTGTGSSGSWRELSPWFADGRLLTASSHVESGVQERFGVSPSSYRTPLLQDLDPTLMTSLNLNCFLIGPIPN